MKAALYCRVSSEEQKKNFSISFQTEELEKYAHDKKLDIYDIYIDSGFSGRSMNRPALKRMLSELQLFDVVLVWKLDRLSRNTSDFQEIKDIIVSNNKILIATTEKSFDFNSSSDTFMFDINSAVAQLYSAQLSERSKAGQKKAKQEGYYVSGTPPFGYFVENRILIINEKEARTVRRIFELSANYNYGAVKTADILYDEGYRSRYNKALSPGKIVAILKNETYYGMIIHNKYQELLIKGERVTIRNKEYELYPGKHEPIIPKEIFELSANNMQNRKTNKGMSAAYENSLFSGLIKCGYCGSTMIHSNAGNQEIYRCDKYMVSDKRHYCSITTKRLLKLFKESLSAFLNDIQGAESLIDKKIQIIENETKQNEQKMLSAEKKLNSINSKKDKLIELYTAQLITLDEFKEKNNIYTIEKNNLTEQLNSLNAFEPSVSVNKEFYKNAVDLFKKYDTLDKLSFKTFVHKIVSEIIIEPSKNPKAKKKITVIFDF